MLALRRPSARRFLVRIAARGYTSRDVMPEPEILETESFTAWHPMLVALLEFYLPGGWRLVPELLLGRLPQRVDILVLRLVEAVAGEVRKLHSVFDHLRPHTLIEHKGPTDDLEPGDALTLLGYAGQYMRLTKVSDPGEVCLMVICDRIPDGFVAQVERMGGTFEAVGAGLWRGKMAGILMRGIETRVAYRTDSSEHLLYTFSRAYLNEPGIMLSLDEEEKRVYTLLYQQVEQFRRQRGNTAMRDIDAALKSYEEVVKEWFEKLPLEKRLAGLAPEERLAGLAPEERLAGLAPEERLAGLDRDQQALALPDEVLPMLTEAYLSSLSPEVQEEIRRRLLLTSH
jgi:hypothetical protein